MKKKVLSMLLIGIMVISGGTHTVLAEEETTTEAVSEDITAESSLLTMGGVDEYNIVWSFVINTETAVACISSTPEGEETTYITGAISFDTEAGTFTITEDGIDYTFGYEDISDTETIITYGEDNDQVQLAVVDPAVLTGESTYDVFAGFESDGTQLTIGFDWDNMAMAIDERDSSESNLFEGIFEVEESEDGTYNVVFHPTEGNDIEMNFAMADEAGTQIDITIGDETIRVSQIDTEALGLADSSTSTEAE